MKTAFLKYIVVLCAMMGAGATLMVVSHKVYRAEIEILRLERAAAQEREIIRNLQAEWAYLTDPVRLEVLAARYLDLVPPVPADVLARFSDVPQPEENLDDLVISPVLRDARRSKEANYDAQIILAGREDAR